MMHVQVIIIIITIIIIVTDNVFVVRCFNKKCVGV